MEHSYNGNSHWYIFFFFSFLTEVEKTKCQHEREVALGSGGAFFPRETGVRHFIPQCDGHGNYLPTQCHSSSGYCWCVDRDGNEIDGTRSGPGVRPPCKWLKHLLLVGVFQPRCTVSQRWCLVMPLRNTALAWSNADLCCSSDNYGSCCSHSVTPEYAFPSARASEPLWWASG